MTDLRGRLDILANEQKEHLTYFLNSLEKDPTKFKRTAPIVAGYYPLLAVADYCLENNIVGFRDKLSESAKYYKMLFVKYEEGESIDASWVSMNAFQNVLSALAGANFSLAKSFVKLMGGRDEIEIEHDHPFDRAFGYTLKAVILDDDYTYAKWLPKMYQEGERKDVQRLVGYADALKAIHDKDKNAFDEAMKKIIDDHKILCRQGGLFDNHPDEVICLWALGMINLARFKGLDVHFNHDYVPEDLIVEKLGCN